MSRTSRWTRLLGALTLFFPWSALALLLNGVPVARNSLLALGVVTGVIYYLVYPRLMKANLRKQHRVARGDALEVETNVTMSEDCITFDADRVKISYHLSDIKKVSVDRKYVEIDIGRRATQLIPLAAFESDGQRDEFLNSFTSIAVES